MKKFNKKAFSLVEVLIVLSIIGFLAIAGLRTINSKEEQYNQPYYNAYNSIKKTAYNVLADLHCPDDSSDDPNCREGVRPYPKKPNDCKETVGSETRIIKGLCSRFAEFLNVTENNCSLLTSNNCTNVLQYGINNKADNFPSRPHLILSNSYRLYFGQMNTMTIGSKMIDYFVVYVDINGEKKPNSVTCQGTTIKPDIVPFAVTRSGDVIPMGYPIYSKQYLTAKIAFPTEYNEKGSVDNYSPSMSFYEAIATAWPQGSAGEVTREHDIPFSLMFADEDAFNGSNIRQCYNNDELRKKQDFIDDAKTLRESLKSRQENDCNKRKEEKEIEETSKCTGANDCIAGKLTCRVTIDSNTATRY